MNISADIASGATTLMNLNYTISCIQLDQASSFFRMNPKGKNPAGDLIGAKHVDQAVNTSMSAKSVGETIKSGSAPAPQAPLIQQSQLFPRPSPLFSI